MRASGLQRVLALAMMAESINSQTQRAAKYSVTLKMRHISSGLLLEHFVGQISTIHAGAKRVAIKLSLKLIPLLVQLVKVMYRVTLHLDSYIHFTSA